MNQLLLVVYGLIGGTSPNVISSINGHGPYGLSNKFMLDQNTISIKLAENPNLVTLAVNDDFDIHIAQELARIARIHEIDGDFSELAIRSSPQLSFRYSVVRSHLENVNILTKQSEELYKNKDLDAARFGLNFQHVFLPEEYEQGLVQKMDVKQKANSTEDPRPRHRLRRNLASALPDTFSWIGSAVPLSVQNQGTCGGSWAFVASAAIDALNYIQNGVKSTVSVQQLLSCATSGGLSGCNGGDPSSVFNWAGYATTNPLVNATQYPFIDSLTGTTSACPSQYVHGNDFQSGVLASGTVINELSNAALQQAISRAPAIVSMYASAQCFQYYSSGTLQASQCSNACISLDHYILGVGWGSYGTSGAYWLLKNQWGPAWGMNGYIKIAVDSSACYGSGILGMLSYISQPQLVTNK